MFKTKIGNFHPRKTQGQLVGAGKSLNGREILRLNFFLARLDFFPPPLTAPGSPRMRNLFSSIPTSFPFLPNFHLLLLYNLITSSKLYLNPLHRHFKMLRLEGHTATLLTIYHKIDSSIANQRAAYVMER